VAFQDIPSEGLSVADKFRREKALRYLIRGIKYIMGYLPDYPIQFTPNCAGDPVEATIRIYWKEEDYKEQLMPQFVIPQLDKMEKDISRISEIVGDSKVSKSVKDHGRS